MMEPTERVEVLGVGRTAIFPVFAMVGLEAVAARAAVGATAIVTAEDDSSEFLGNLGRFPSHV